MNRRRHTRIPPEDLLRQAFDAYNRQDVDALLAIVGDDVTWATDGEPVHGKDDLRSYWDRQWRWTRTYDEVICVEHVSEGRYAVELHQIVRSIEGAVRSTGRFRYEFVLKNGTIDRLVSRSVSAGVSSSHVT